MSDSADLATVVLFDGERCEPLNNWGGGWGVGDFRDVRLQSQTVRSGRGALRLEPGPRKAGQRASCQCYASGFGRTDLHHQTRDLTRYERLELYLKGDGATAWRGTLELRDHRNSRAHAAVHAFALRADEDWQRIGAPLSLAAPGWALRGQPDLSQVTSIELAVEPETDTDGGPIFLDDFVLVEPGGPVDVRTRPLTDLVARLARRQWDALWTARGRTHGLIPNHSYQAADAGLNTTAAVLWMLPAATRRGWVEPKQADQYAAQLVETIDLLMDRSRYLPPRTVDWLLLDPSLLPEESSVDAAFLALALHQYRALRATPAALRAAIERTVERFDFAAFVRPDGWCMAYRYPTRHDREGFLALTYNGYTSEADLISLAAHLARRCHVPIETCWHSDVYRDRVRLAPQGRSAVVHSLAEFRAPFVQALWNLFVDVRDRGTDNYPDARLAANPWENFVAYQQDVLARLAELGRPCLVQPDAGDDGTLENYRPYNLYYDFGRDDLFMPWSAAFALLAEADGAEEALRFLLLHQLHGPLGLADSARWATGAAAPYAVTARHDYWNTALSTMALLEWLDGDDRSSKSFAALPEVRAALDRVFGPAGIANQ